MAAPLFESYAHHLAVIGDRPIRVGRVDGSWRLAIRGHDWQVYDDALECFSDIAGVLERNRVRAWVAELLGVREVELHSDTRWPTGFVVSVEA